MDTERLNIIKHRVRERLVALDMTAQDASRQSALGLSYVNDLLCGKISGPHAARLAQLAETLKCNAGWLGGDDLFPDESAKTEPLNEALVLRAAREIEGECRDLSHAVLIARKVMESARNA